MSDQFTLDEPNRRNNSPDVALGLDSIYRFSLASTTQRKEENFSDTWQADNKKRAELAISALNRRFPLVNHTNWEQCASLIPQVQALSKTINEYEIVSSEAARLLHQAGYYLLECAEFNEAEPLLLDALRLYETIYGNDHTRVAIALSNLATLFKDTNRVVEAERLLRRALSIDERLFGKDDPAVAVDLNNLATVLQAANRFAEAELLLRRALLIDELNYGNDHPRVAMGLNNLATLLMENGRLIEAQQILQQGIAIFQNELGCDHPYTLIAYENYEAVMQVINDNEGMDTGLLL